MISYENGGTGDGMKVRVERDKIIKAVKKLDGIEIVLENAADAKEAVDLILRKTDLFKSDLFRKLKDIVVTATQEYKTSAVDYNVIFTLEFCFEAEVALDMKVAFIRELQEFFSRF
jgi:copper chaperone CopZ